jgi:hypothetical protein
MRRFYSALLRKNAVLPHSSVKSDPIFLISEYGDLLNIKSLARSKTAKTGKTDYREVRMIDDNMTGQ